MSNTTGSTAFEYFEFSCPKGGDFYICQNETTQFIGCCASNPCADGGECPTADLRTSTFNADRWSDLPAQDCSNSNSTKNWYTCRDTDPPFMGCCLESACGTGQCPQDMLAPARLSDISSNVRRLLNPSGAATATSTASPESDSGLSTGAIAGIAVGAAAGGLIVLGLLIWFCWVQPRKKKKQQAAAAAQASQQGHLQMAQPGSPGTFIPSETPMSNYQASFSSTPTTAHYPSGTTDMYGNKLSPYPPGYDRPTSMSTFSDASGGVNRGYNNGYSPVPMVPVQEMDGTSTPHEMSTGQEQFIARSEDQDQQGYHSRTQNPYNHLGISS